MTDLTESMVTSIAEVDPEDYAALRQGVALLDLSSIGLIEVVGDDAQSFLEGLLPREVEFLFEERSLTTVLLDDSGHPLDLLVLYREADGFLLETSLGRGVSTLDEIRRAAGADVVVRPSERRLISVEGPYAWRVVADLCGADVAAMPYQGVQRPEIFGVEMMVARNGSTAEFGYKVILPAQAWDDLWRTLAATARPCGLPALETAMIEVRQPVPTREWDEETTAIEAGLNWLIEPEKETFRGREAVVAEFEAGPRSLTVNFLTNEPPGSLGTGVEIDGKTVGRVVHAVHSPAFSMTLGLARVEPQWAVANLPGTFGGAPGMTIGGPAVVPLSWTIRPDYGAPQ